MNTNDTNSIKPITGDPLKDANIRETSFLVLKARKLAEEAKAKQAKQTKPDWITDEQWRINPNVYHWERSRRAMESNELSKKSPITMEEAREQMVKRYESVGLSRKDYEDSLK